MNYEEREKERRGRETKKERERDKEREREREGHRETEKKETFNKRIAIYLYTIKKTSDLICNSHHF